MTWYHVLVLQTVQRDRRCKLPISQVVVKGSTVNCQRSPWLLTERGADNFGALTLSEDPVVKRGR